MSPAAPALVTAGRVQAKTQRDNTATGRLGRDEVPPHQIGCGALLGLFLLIMIIGILAPTPPDPGHPAGGNLADLLAAYHAQNPPDGIPGGLIDAAAKDACIGLAKMTNPLPGENEKAETYFVVQSLQSKSTQDVIGQQPFTVRLAQAQAIVAAAEKVLPPGLHNPLNQRGSCRYLAAAPQRRLALTPSPSPHTYLTWPCAPFG